VGLGRVVIIVGGFGVGAAAGLVLAGLAAVLAAAVFDGLGGSTVVGRWAAGVVTAAAVFAFASPGTVGTPVIEPVLQI